MSMRAVRLFVFFFFNDTATTEIYTLSLHDALPIWAAVGDGAGIELAACDQGLDGAAWRQQPQRSEEHTSELQSHLNLVCRLLLEKKKITDSSEEEFQAKSKKGEYTFQHT